MATSAVALNVMFELFDDELLIVNDVLDQIANRYDSDEFLVLEHGKMTHSPSSHDAHAFLNGLIWNVVNTAIVVWLLLRPTHRLAVAE